MKVSEFKRWLAAQGAQFKEGSKHTKVYLGDKRSVLPRHPSKELPTGTVKAIKEQLGLD
jgi:mRNA interferase HicA